MGYVGKLREKQLAINLRKQGLSYNEIRRTVKVSKDTLSRWCRDVYLSINQLERLKRKKIKGAERGRLIGAKRQQEKRLKTTKAIYKKSREEIGNLNKRDRFIAGITLYSGEGYKSDKSIGFINSDPDVISFMMAWFREFCRISESKFRGQIWIHDNLNEKKAREFWSGLTKIPESQFRKSYIAQNKLNSNKIRKRRHEYGIFAIKVDSAYEQRRILGWIKGVLGCYNLHAH